MSGVDKHPGQEGARPQPGAGSEPTPSPDNAEAEAEAAPEQAPEAAQPEAEQGAAKAPPAKPGPRRGAVWAGLLAALALVLGVAALAGGAYLWQQLVQLGEHVQHQADRAAGQVEGLRQDLDRRLSRLERRQEAIDSQQQSLAEGFAALRRTVGRDRQDWVLAEAAYLLLVANHRLQLQHDVATAIAALEAADRRLGQQGDPSLIPVREQIAREISALRAVPRPDLEGIALRLASLSERVDTIPVRTLEMSELGEAPPPAETEAPAPEDVPAWRRGAERMWSELRKLVVIRRHEEPVAPLLSPQQESLVRQVLRLRIESARLALLEGDPQLYRDQLKSARAWLGGRFAEDPARKAMMEALADLAEHEIRPPLPDISGSLKKLREHAESRRRAREAAPPAQPLAPAPEGPAGASPAPESKGEAGVESGAGETGTPAAPETSAPAPPAQPSDPGPDEAPPEGAPGQ